MADVFDEIAPAKDVFDEISSPPKVELTAYEKLRMQGIGPGLSATTGPPNPEEIIPFYESLTKPPVEIPRLEGKTTAGKIAAGIANVPAGIYNTVVSPVGLATLPLGGSRIGAAALKGIFSGLAAKEAGRTLGEASVTGDPQQYTEGALQALLAPAIALPGTLTPTKGLYAPKERIVQENIPGERPGNGEVGTPGQTGSGGGLQPEAGVAKETQIPLTTERRTLNTQYGDTPKGTAVELTGEKGTDPLNPWIGVKLPNGQTAHLPPDWLSVGEKIAPNLPALIKKFGRTQVEAWIGEWDSSANLSEDGKSITAFADPRNQTGRGRASTKEFIDFLSSEASPINTESPQSAPEIEVETTGAVESGQRGGGAAEAGELPGAGEGPDIYGIAERVREERAAAGQTPPLEPGEGVSARESVLYGRTLLERDPESASKAADKFVQTKAIDYDGLAAVRAKGEEAFQKARRIEEQFGTDSDEYRAAQAEGAKWDAVSKNMQTEWHKLGMAQQGHTDLDTGSFTGLNRHFQDLTGTDIPEAKIPKAKKIAKASGDADKEVEAQRAETFSHLDREYSRRRKAVDAEQAALDAAHKTVRENAVRIADLENKANAAKAAKDTTQEKAIRKALDAANKSKIDAARKAAELERKLQSDPSARVWNKAKEYLDKGTDDFSDLINKVATDLGMRVDRVKRLLAQDRRSKQLTDDLWRKQQKARTLKQQAQRWVENQAVPGYQRALESIPRTMFSLKVGFHGTVALGTHAPMVAFQPRFWKTYATDFGKMYKMVGSPAFYESEVRNLMARKNYLTARRAGLINDPFQYEDYNSPQVSEAFGRFTGMGNRGYSVLKILRQDMFDQVWNQLTKTSQIPEVAQGISDSINHATGVVRVQAPKGANIALFAPRLEASRVAWLFVDPTKSALTFANWRNATPKERAFATYQLKEKAWVFGTMASLLALNQGFLSATGSDQKINIDDPMRSDFLKFKVGGMNVSYGNAMITMARFPVRMVSIARSERGKGHNVYPDETVYGEVGKYVRSQMSPFAGTLTDLLFLSDYAHRPLPGSTRPVPRRLRAEGVEPYTWGEFIAERALPIPFEEAVKEVWKDGLGMTDQQIENYFKAFLTIGFMGGTGGRLTEDFEPKQNQ